MIEFDGELLRFVQSEKLATTHPQDSFLAPENNGKVLRTSSSWPTLAPMFDGYFYGWDAKTNTSSFGIRECRLA